VLCIKQRKPQENSQKLFLNFKQDWQIFKPLTNCSGTQSEILAKKNRFSPYGKFATAKEDRRAPGKQKKEGKIPPRKGAVSLQRSLGKRR